MTIGVSLSVPQFLDLDDDDDVGTLLWKRVGAHHILQTSEGTAVLCEMGDTTLGVIVYDDGMICELPMGPLHESKETAAQFLKKKPKPRGLHNVIEDDVEPAPVMAAPAPPAPTEVRRPRPPRRQWTTTPIERGRSCPRCNFYPCACP